MIFWRTKRAFEVQKQTSKNVVDTIFKLLLLRKGWHFQNLNFKSLKNSSLKKLRLTQISLNFKTSCCNLKIEGLWKKNLWRFLYLCFVLEKFHFKQEIFHFLCEKTLLNIIYGKKGIFKYSHKGGKEKVCWKRLKKLYW